MFSKYYLLLRGRWEFRTEGTARTKQCALFVHMWLERKKYWEVMGETVKMDWEESECLVYPVKEFGYCPITQWEPVKVFEQTVASLSWTSGRSSWWLSIRCLKRVRLGMGIQAGG